MIRFRLISLTGITFDQDVYEIILPTTTGLIGVLEKHMPLVSVAADGVVAVRHQPNDGDNRLEYFTISGGVIEIADNTLTLLVDEADIEKDLSSAKAEQARMMARRLREETGEQVSLDQAHSMIDRQAVRLQVAGLKRRRR